MGTKTFLDSLKKEINRIDEQKTTKRTERIIEGFTHDVSPKAIIQNKEYYIFNSNDYLGLRHHSQVKIEEQKASESFGTGPGAVRFISGTLKTHKQLEQATAAFHNRDDAMIFSSAFAANLAVMFCMSQGLTKDSQIDSNVLIVSDALNHRSIIDGIRLTGLSKDQRTIFAHMDMIDLERILKENIGKFNRILVVTDGVFSMLGEIQHVKTMRKLIDTYSNDYKQGILLIVDDAHGVGIGGSTGKGTEEIESVQADILIGTYGKAFGADGGYVVANQTIIDYLRESSATYIYSNSISPGTAGAALASLHIVTSNTGKKLLTSSKKQTEYFKEHMKQRGFSFSAESNHPIQPVLIGDTAKTKKLVELLFHKQILVTNISYPVVSKGKDEIRVQISATHTKEDIDYLVNAFSEAYRHL